MLEMKNKRAMMYLGVLGVTTLAIGSGYYYMNQFYNYSENPYVFFKYDFRIEVLSYLFILLFSLAIAFVFYMVGIYFLFKKKENLAKSYQYNESKDFKMIAGSSGTEFDDQRYIGEKGYPFYVKNSWNMFAKEIIFLYGSHDGLLVIAYSSLKKNVKYSVNDYLKLITWMKYRSPRYIQKEVEYIHKRKKIASFLGVSLFVIFTIAYYFSNDYLYNLNIQKKSNTHFIEKEYFKKIAQNDVDSASSFLKNEVVMQALTEGKIKYLNTRRENILQIASGEVAYENDFGAIKLLNNAANFNNIVKNVPLFSGYFTEEIEVIDTSIISKIVTYNRDNTALLVELSLSALKYDYTLPREIQQMLYLTLFKRVAKSIYSENKSNESEQTILSRFLFNRFYMLFGGTIEMRVKKQEDFEKEIETGIDEDLLYKLHSSILTAIYNERELNNLKNVDEKMKRFLMKIYKYEEGANHVSK